MPLLAPFNAEIAQRLAAVNAKNGAKNGRRTVAKIRAGSVPAGLGPEVDPAVGRVAVDLAQLLGCEGELVERGDILFELRHAAGADQCGGDAWVPQRPDESHLGQRLAAPLGQLVQGPHLPER